MKKIIISIVLVLSLYLMCGCSIGNTVQIKNLKDDMKLMQCKIDSLEIQMKELQVSK